MKIEVYSALRTSVVPPEEAYVAVIMVGKHVRTFTFGATQEEADSKAAAYVAKVAAKAARLPGKKKAADPASDLNPDCRAFETATTETDDETV